MDGAVQGLVVGDTKSDWFWCHPFGAPEVLHWGMLPSASSFVTTLTRLAFLVSRLWRSGPPSPSPLRRRRRVWFKGRGQRRQQIPHPLKGIRDDTKSRVNGANAEIGALARRRLRVCEGYGGFRSQIDASGDGKKQSRTERRSPQRRREHGEIQERAAAHGERNE